MGLVEMIQAIEEAGKLEQFDWLVTLSRVFQGHQIHSEGYTREELERVGDIVMPRGWRNVPKEAVRGILK